MLHPKATIERPAQKSFDTSNVIKSDQFPSWHKNFADKLGIGTLFKSALNMRSLDTVKEWGQKLMRQHRPADLLALPDFMRPQLPGKAPVSLPKFSLPVAGDHKPPVMQAPAKVAPLTPIPPPQEESAKKLLCAHCGAKISFAEGKFCWNNAKRFGGLAYCRAHQALA